MIQQANQPAFVLLHSSTNNLSTVVPNDLIYMYKVYHSLDYHV